MLENFGSLLVFGMLLNGVIFGAANQEAFTLKSSAFEEPGQIPKEYTCKGRNLSPPLSWSSPPKETKSFALIVRDPDAPGGNLIHWIIFNIPHTTTHLPAGVRQNSTLEGGIYQGLNDHQHQGYDGPCPPPGKKHSYTFALYALDTKLHLNPGISYSEFQDKIEGHILGEADLIGTFETVETSSSESVKSK